MSWGNPLTCRLCCSTPRSLFSTLNPLRLYSRPSTSQQTASTRCLHPRTVRPLSASRPGAPDDARWRTRPTIQAVRRRCSLEKWRLPYSFNIINSNPFGCESWLVLDDMVAMVAIVASVVDVCVVKVTACVIRTVLLPV